jgi:hypothetical protein
VEAVVITLVFIIAIVSNLLVLVILCTTKEKRLPSNYFIGNLAIAGIIAVSSAPFMAITRVTGTWLFGRICCGLTGAIQYCATIVTVWTMAFISLDRHQGTYKRAPFRTKPIIIMIGVLWIVAICGSAPLGMFFITSELEINNETVRVCTLVWPYNDKVHLSMVFTLPSILIMFMLPLCIILISYARVVKKLEESIKKFKSNTEGKSLWNRTLFSKHKEMRVVRLLILLVVCFCILWLPISIAFVMLFYDGITDALIMTSQLFVSTVIIAMTSACVCPVIYAFVNERLRRGFKKVVCRKKNKIDNATVFTVN